MTLETCRECSQPVSSLAMKCPHCGAPTPHSVEVHRQGRRLADGLLVLLTAPVWAPVVFGLLVFLLWCR
jgi:hypothetical protein